MQVVYMFYFLYHIYMDKLKDILFKKIDNYISNYISEKLNKYSINTDKNTLVNDSLVIDDDTLFFADFEIDKDVDLTLDNVIIEDKLIKECSSIYKIIIDTLNNLIIYVNNASLEEIPDKVKLFNSLHDFLVSFTLKSIELNLVSKNRVYVQHRMLLDIKKHLSNTSFTLMLIINKINNSNYKNIENILNTVNYLNTNIEDLQIKLDNLVNLLCKYIETTDDILIDNNDLMTKEPTKLYKNSLKLVKNAYTIINETNNNISSLKNKDRSIDLLTSNKYKDDILKQEIVEHIDKSLEYLKSCKNETIKCIDCNNDISDSELAEIAATSELAMNYALPCVQKSAISLLSSSINIQIENNINSKDKDFMFEDNIHYTNLQKCLNTLDKVYNFGL